MPEEFDPFGDEPETDDLPPATPKKTTRKPAVKKETTTVADETNDRSGLTITFKGGAGFDAPWIVLHARDLTEADTFLAEENRELLKRVMERTQAAGKFFVDQAPAKTPGASSGAPDRGAQGRNTGQGPAPSQGAPDGETRYCAHGKMQPRSGVSESTGRPWKGFFCPTPKGTPDQCKPQFLR